jgi:hypothetical protein
LTLLVSQAIQADDQEGVERALEVLQRIDTDEGAIQSADESQ